MLLSRDNVLHYTHDTERLQIESWGLNALRIRATKFLTLPAENGALTGSPPPKCQPAISMQEDHATIVNGEILARISSRGKIIIQKTTGERLLDEHVPSRYAAAGRRHGAVMAEARDFKPLFGGDYHLTYRLNSIDVAEKLYAMGHHVKQFVDLTGLDLELAQRRSQANVPFMLSTLGYGFLWNNPSLGRAILGKSTMTFEAVSTKVLDYWIVCADSPAQIIEAYAAVTGKVPLTPERGLGVWQCRLRYRTKEELLGVVAHECQNKTLPLDVIIVDLFHWPKHGEWKFDSAYWKDPGESSMRRLLATWKESPSPAPAPSPASVFTHPYDNSLELQPDSILSHRPLSTDNKQPLIKIEASEI